MPEPQVTKIVVPRERFSHTERTLEDIYEQTSVPFNLVYVSGKSPVHIQRYLELESQRKGFRLIPAARYLSPNEARNFDYLPFNKVMKNVAAVIHHGGRGTLSSAIAAGVPQLVLAMGADRPDNAIRLKGLGVADYLPPPAWKPAAVAEKLSAIIHSEVVAQTCRTLAARMAATDALGSACDLIERVIAEGQG